MDKRLNLKLQAYQQMDMVDQLQINFSSDSLVLLNFLLAFIMFGIALEVKVEDFKMLAKNPKPVILGAVSQFILLPALTFLLVITVKPNPSIALGMMLVAACPGGNISNFITHISGGNAALSVSLTGLATALSLFFTPFNLQFWASQYEPTAEILRTVQVNPVEIFKTVALILILPLVLGMYFQYRFTKLANTLSSPMKTLSVLIFMGFVVVAFSKNTEVFTTYIGMVFTLVLAHNALAFITGYSTALVGKLSEPNRRTLAIETGIQNSGLGLLLIFAFFDGLGGMALTAAWWGIWHLISGMSIAFYWGRIKRIKLETV